MTTLTLSAGIRSRLLAGLAVVGAAALALGGCASATPEGEPTTASAVYRIGISGPVLSSTPDRSRHNAQLVQDR
ncbi:hypothetical protein [Microbacterium memoriense]|uniref:ABC transporter substrate-binding protein n=1 Tax=Microbacterium memoriense TaxID=2978350 RepID=A0ABT2PBX1_9MICO|nr:hypothetical protein [Microbacterium memoriense]MCT9001929.1 hypothetical protein [Microbacterium memoriense]